MLILVLVFLFKVNFSYNSQALFYIAGGALNPALLKESGKVTLIGATTGGGACAVQTGSTADGTILNFSSSMRISVVCNGSYYTVDRGIEPHYHLSKIESFYDRAGLTEYINNLK